VRAGELHDFSNPARQWGRAGLRQAANVQRVAALGDGVRPAALEHQLGDRRGRGDGIS